MFHSEEQSALTTLGNAAVPDGRPDAAHMAAGIGKTRFRPLSTEERRTYRRWRRSALIFYGACALVLAVAAVTRSLPATPSSLAGKGDDHSTIAVASRQHVLD